MSTTSSFRALSLLAMAAAYPIASNAVGMNWDVAVALAPPLLPVVEQPPCPQVGYLWAPGYWAYDSDLQTYFWVSGSWVLAPAAGLLWTPGFWAENSGGYVWNAGYWGPHVGYYGGINYGFGYFGSGFVGGYWHGRDFFYNRSVENVTRIRVTNVYNTTVIDRFDNHRVSFNGPHGVHVGPSNADRLAQREPHRGPTDAQRRLSVASHVRSPRVLSAHNTRPAQRSTVPIAPAKYARALAGREQPHQPLEQHRLPQRVAESPAKAEGGKSNPYARYSATPRSQPAAHFLAATHAPVRVAYHAPMRAHEPTSRHPATQETHRGTPSNSAARHA